MSYERVMDKRFVKVSEDLYLPLYLHGSNNCTMFERGREVLQRYWSVFFADCSKNLLCSENSMIEYCKQCIDEHSSHSDYPCEWYTVNGNWIVGDKILSQIHSACKNALTIEEYIEYGRNAIYCSMVLCDKDTDDKKEINYLSPKTTAELIEWCKQYAEYKCDEKHNLYVNISFYSNTPLRIVKPIPSNKKVIAKYGKRYVTEWSENRLSYSENKADAKVMTAEEFNELAKHWAVKSASAETKTVIKDFVIMVTGGLRAGAFVQKLSAHSLFFATRETYAKRFRSEKEAQRYIDEKLKGRFPNCTDFTVYNINQ